MKNIYAEICKVNEEERMVYGYASTEAMDVQGERVSKDALAKALPEYMKFANIREMHTASAVGVAKSADIDDKGLYLSCKVVDDIAWNKVKEGVYKGFSIGGKSVSKVDETITELRLSEISLVDRPANPEAVIELWKSDMNTNKSEAQLSAVDELAEILNKGEITPEVLVEFAKSQNKKEAAVENTEETAVEKADVPDLKKYAGEEIQDAATAIQALAAAYWLLEREAEEVEDYPEQVAALKQVVASLKAFIASEIQEDNSEEMGEEEANSAMIEYADKIGNIAKAGKTISAATMTKLQGLHDQVVGLGAKCSKGDDVAMSDHGHDLQKSEGDKANDVMAKIAQFEEKMEKVIDENTLLKSEVEKLKAMPQAGKALLRAINKGDDMILENQKSSVDTISGPSGTVNEAASLIKMIHQQGGIKK